MKHGVCETRREEEREGGFKKKVEKREGEERARKRETESFYPPVHFSDGCNSWGWTRLQPSQNFYLGVRGSAVESLPSYLPGGTNRKVDQKQDKDLSRRFNEGCGSLTQGALPIVPQHLSIMTE